jgi:hypothetical protein
MSEPNLSQQSKQENLQKQSDKEPLSELREEENKGVNSSLRIGNFTFTTNKNKRKHPENITDKINNTISEEQPIKRRKTQDTENEQSTTIETKQSIETNDQFKEPLLNEIDTLKLTSTASTKHFTSPVSSQLRNLIPVSLTFSPNSACMAILYEDLTLQVIPLVHFCPSGTTRKFSPITQRNQNRRASEKRNRNL